MGIELVQPAECPCRLSHDVDYIALTQIIDTNISMKNSSQHETFRLLIHARTSAASPFTAIKTIQQKLSHNIVHCRVYIRGTSIKQQTKGSAAINVGTSQPYDKGSTSSLPSSLRTFRVAFNTSVTQLKANMPTIGFLTIQCDSGLPEPRYQPVVHSGTPKNGPDDRGPRRPW